MWLTAPAYQAAQSQLSTDRIVDKIMQNTHKIYFLISIFLFGLAHVSAQELAPSKSTYKPGEDVVISFSDGPGNAKDWVGIYKEGQTPGDVVNPMDICGWQDIG